MKRLEIQSSFFLFERFIIKAMNKVYKARLEHIKYITPLGERMAVTTQYLDLDVEEVARDLREYL